MPIQILMPALSPTMTEGKLAKWLKREGDAVRAGDVLAEIETDKATMEVEAVDEGILGRILVAEGSERVAVNQPIALLLSEGEDAAALDASPIAAPPAAPPTAATAPAAAAAPAPTVAAPPPRPAAATTPSAASALAPGNRRFSSPLARRMAAEGGLDLAAIRGSGPHGRIVKRDVEAALAAAAARPAAPAPAATAAPTATAAEPAAAKPAFRELPHSTTRKVIARRLSASKRDIPHYYLTIHCAIDALLALRDQLNGRAPAGEGGYRLSINDFVVRAVALAMRRHPECNAAWSDHALLLYEAVDVCVAVAAPNGLITPIVRNADHKGLATISNEVKVLAGKARDGKLSPEEYQGGGFTVSNLGMYGISEFAAIINPPQTCLLAVGAGEKRPVVEDGALAVATMMTCTLSADHRAVDGAKGAEFLATFKELLEEPLTMLL
jgi:pyruvate dehydrogenase E2 component (dihydrolipoamide acetyltransferase)